MLTGKYIRRVLIFVLFFSACNGSPTSVNISNTSTVEVTQTDEAPQNYSLNENSVEADSEQNSSDTGTTNRNDDWSEITHGKNVEPDYGVVFPQDVVNRIDISIEPADWQVMFEDMTAHYGEFGSQPSQGPGNKRFPGEGDPPVGMNPPQQEFGNIPQPGNNALPPDRNQLPETRNRLPMEQEGGFGGMESDTNPVYVPATVEFDGKVWNYVGIRFKGNSSLRSTWGSGSLKLPFRLDYDQFEDNYPEIVDQRFYGFKQLAFSSNWKDASYLREKVTADIFREAGVPAVQTAFYEVYLDYGEGSVYLGLYTLTEIVDDTLIETQFEDDNGNVYKPSGNGATSAEGSFSEQAFDKQTNQDEGDWSDIMALFKALHAESRTSAPEKWRNEFEAVFDVDEFLNWLAVNTVIQNWDTYGTMSHNYYLYHDPVSDKLVWIPWDNNEALIAKMGTRSTTSFEMDEIDERWPLIRFLLNDEVYHATYVSYVKAVINGAFEPEQMEGRYREYVDLIESSVRLERTSELGVADSNGFNVAIEELVQHAYARYDNTTYFLAQQ